MKNVFHTRLRWAALGLLSAVCFSGFAQVPQGTLKEVVVTASRFDEERMSAPAAIQVITQEDIKKSGASSVPDVLMMLGGVNVRDISGGQLKLSSSVDLGGFGATAAGNTLILIDGRRLNPIDSSEVAWAGVNISSIDRIEIAQGAFGVQYGGGATGGVINIVTKNALADLNKVEMGTGSFGTKFGKAHYVKRTGDTSVSLQAGVAGSDGWRENSGSRSQNFSLRGQKKIDGSKNILGEIFSSEQNSAMSGGVVGKVGEGDLRAAKFNNVGSEQNVKNYGLRLGGLFALSDASSLDLEFIYEKKSSALLRPFYNTSDSIGSYLDENNDLVQYSNGPGKILSSGANLNFSPKIKTNFSNGASLVYGYDYRKADQAGEGIYGDPVQRVFRNNGNTFFRDLQSVQLTNQSTYILVKTPLFSELNLTLGMRREVQSFDTSDVNIKSIQSLATSGAFASNAQEISLQRKMSEQSKTYLRLTQSYRFANTDEFWGFDASDNRVFSGALKPQVSKGYEIGYDARGVSSQLSVVYGQSVTKDEIRYDPSVFQNANISDDISREQLTIATRQTFRASTILFGKLMYQKVQFASGQFSGQTPGLIPDFVLSLGMTQKLDVRTWSGFYLNHVSRQNYDVSPVLNQMPSFNVMDAFISRSYGNIESKFTIKNVLGGVNASSGGYGFVSGPGGTGANSYYYYPSDPRSFHLSVNYKY